MSQLVEFLNENKNGTFATIKDNKPVMRQFRFVMEKDDRFYFMTANTKEVYKQLKEAGVAGFAVFTKTGWARLNGEVKFVDSLELKEEALESDPMIRNFYKTADNPVLEIFYIHNGTASLYKNFGTLVEELEI